LPVQIFVVFFFVLALATLLLLSGLAGLTLLAVLAGLVAVLPRLSALSTLLLVFLHIVCHEMSTLLGAQLGAPQFESPAPD
jgi:hypothetical protein